MSQQWNAQRFGGFSRGRETTFHLPKVVRYFLKIHPFSIPIQDFIMYSSLQGTIFNAREANEGCFRLAVACIKQMLKPCKTL